MTPPTQSQIVMALSCLVLVLVVQLSTLPSLMSHHWQFCYSSFIDKVYLVKKMLWMKPWFNLSHQKPHTAPHMSTSCVLSSSFNWCRILILTSILKHSANKPRSFQEEKAVHGKISCVEIYFCYVRSSAHPQQLVSLPSFFEKPSNKHWSDTQVNEFLPVPSNLMLHLSILSWSGNFYIT